MGKGISKRVRDAIMNDINDHLETGRPLSNLFDGNLNKTMMPFFERYEEQIAQDQEIMEMLKSMRLDNQKAIPEIIMRALESVPLSDPVAIRKPNISQLLTIDAPIEIVDPEIILDTSDLSEESIIKLDPNSLVQAETIEMPAQTKQNGNAFGRRSLQGTYSSDFPVFESRITDERINSSKAHIAGTYKVLSELGVGGQAKVFLTELMRAWQSNEKLDEIIFYLEKIAEEKAERRTAQGLDVEVFPIELGDKVVTRDSINQKILAYKRILQKIANDPEHPYYALVTSGSNANKFATKVVEVNPKTETENSIDRIEREIRLGLHCNHPNIVKIFDTGRGVDTSGKNPITFYYYAMELLPEALEDSLRIDQDMFDKYGAKYEPMWSVRQIQNQRFDNLEDCVAGSIDDVMDMSKGLWYLHNVVKIIHRDIKLENARRGLDDLVKLTDFGLLKHMDPKKVSIELTQEGTVMGSIFYLAPEMWKDSKGNASTASDVYALGVCLYERLLGMHPYDIEFVTNWVEAADVVAPKKDKTSARGTGNPLIWPNLRYKYEEKKIKKLEDECEKFSVNEWSKKKNLEREIASRKIRLNEVVNTDVIDLIDKRLATIMMKSIHPYVNERYQTIDEFFRDIEAWYNDFTGRQAMNYDLGKLRDSYMDDLNKLDEILNSAFKAESAELKKEALSKLKAWNKGFSEKNSRRLLISKSLRDNLESIKDLDYMMDRAFGTAIDKYRNFGELLNDLKLWRPDFIEDMIKLQELVPKKQFTSLERIPTVKIFESIDSQAESGYYKRKGKNIWYRRFWKPIVGVAAGLGIGTSVLFGALSDSGGADNAFQSLQQTITRAEEEFDSGNYSKALELIRSADEIATSNSEQFNEERFRLLDEIIDDRAEDYEKKFILNKVESVYNVALNKIRNERFIDAEDDLYDALNKANSLASEYIGHQVELKLLAEDILEKINDNEKDIIHELSRNLEGKKLLKRLSDYKLEDLLNLPRDKFLQYVENGSWKLVDSDFAVNLGAKVKLFLNLYEATNDERYLKAAIESEDAIGERYKNNNVSMFGRDYIDSTVALQEIFPTEQKIKRIINAADALSKRINQVGDYSFLQAAGNPGHFPRIISVFSLEDSILFYHAFNVTGNEDYIYDLKSNLDSVLNFNLRSNGSFYGRVKLDENGNVEKRDGSRGNENAVVSEKIGDVISTYAFAYEVFKDQKYLDAGVRTGDFAIDLLKRQGSWIPNWDSDSDVLDTKAAISIALGLYRLSEVIEDGNRYREVSEAITKEVLEYLNLNGAGLIKGGSFVPRRIEDTSFISSDADLTTLLSLFTGVEEDKKYISGSGYRSDLLNEKSGRLAFENSTKFIIWDDSRNLYFVAVCKSENLEGSLGNDSKLWEEECVGIRIYDESIFYDILVSPNGAVYDSKGRLGKGWSSGAKIDVDKRNGEYTVRIEIPKSRVGIEGEEVKFNVLRSSRDSISSFAYLEKPEQRWDRRTVAGEVGNKKAILRLNVYK